MSLWSLDAASGDWKKSGEFTYSGGRRRRRDVPYINFDKPIYRERLCTIAVYVYYAADFSVLMPGERLTAYMMQNGLFFGRTTAYTKTNGKACLLVQGLSLRKRPVSSYKACLLVQGLSPRTRPVSSYKACLLVQGLSPRTRPVSSYKACLLVQGLSPRTV